MGIQVAYPQVFIPSVLAGWPAEVSFMLGAMAGAWGLLWGLSQLASLPNRFET
ncbi:MAG: hypothetical protein HC913_07550 [Microscillaceae bacterium]|nr:hypothetical protein [Microscillaceae bacterium]